METMTLLLIFHFVIYAMMWHSPQKVSVLSLAVFSMLKHLHELFVFLKFTTPCINVNAG